MTEFEESDISYMTGMLAGVLRAAITESSQNLSFDEEKWRELYGEDIVYTDLPGYPSEEAMRKEEDPLTIMDWDVDREIATLVPGSDLPTDRSGSMVFADGTVVTTRGGKPKIYTLSESLLALVWQLRNRRLKIIRDVYDFDPQQQ